jgi:hypothetical protein
VNDIEGLLSLSRLEIFEGTLGDTSFTLPLSLLLLGDEEILLLESWGSGRLVISDKTEGVLDVFISTSGLVDLDLVSLEPALPVTFDEAGAGLSLYLLTMTETGEFSISIETMFFVFDGDTEGNFLWTADPERGREIVTLEVLFGPGAEALEEVEAFPSNVTKGAVEGLGCIAWTIFGAVLLLTPSKLEVEARFLSVFPALDVVDPGVFELDDKSSLLDKVGFDLLLAITLLAGLASTGGGSLITARAAAAAFAFSLSVVALLLCLTVLLRYKPSGSSFDAVFRNVLFRWWMLCNRGRRYWATSTTASFSIARIWIGRRLCFSQANIQMAWTNAHLS